MKWLLVNMLLLGMILPAEGVEHRPHGAVPPTGEDGFKLVRARNGINLYERWVEIQPGLKVRELKAEFTTDAGVESLVALLKDATRAHRWMQGMEEFKVVENQGATAWTSYIRYSIPWPLEDQDILLKYQSAGVKGLQTVSFQSTTHATYPEKSGVTRMKGVSGSWQFQPRSSGQTQVTYYIITKNKSSYPRWITDPIVQDNLLDTMDAFIEQAEELHAQR